MKSVEQMTVNELNSEIKYVSSKLKTNPAGPQYLKCLQDELEKRKK